MTPEAVRRDVARAERNIAKDAAAILATMDNLEWEKANIVTRLAAWFMTNRECAEFLGISQQHLCYLLKNRRHVSRNLLSKIIAACKTGGIAG